MNLFKLLGGQSAVDAASATAQQTADQYWQELAPYIYAAAFMGATAWLFYFVPRFRLPWDFKGN